MWGDRLDASIYTCANQKVADQTKDLVKKAEKKKYSSDDILALVNKDSQLNLFRSKAENFLRVIIKLLTVSIGFPASAILLLR